MKSNIKRGSDFSGLCRYILRRSAKADLIGGNLAGMTAQELTMEFRQVAALRPDIKKTVWHSSLALPKGDRLKNEQWNQIVEDYLEGLGFDLKTTPFVVVRHQNTQSDHVHIAASRVNLSGNLYLGKNEHLIATQLTQKIELKHNLTVTPGPGHKAQQKALKTTEKAMAARTGKVPPRRQLQLTIDNVVSNNSSLSIDDFIKKLAEVGVIAKPNLSKSGKMSGFSFKISDIAFKASQLGKNYGWQTLEKRLQQQPDNIPQGKVSDFGRLRVSEPPKPPFVQIRNEGDKTEVAENREEIKLLSAQLWQEKKKTKRRQGIISRIINWRRQQIFSKEIEQLKRRNAELRAKEEARIMAPATPENRKEYDQIIGDFCKLQVSKDMKLQHFITNYKAFELALQQTNGKLAHAENRKAELLGVGQDQGWGPNTPPPPIWQPLQRKAHAAWIKEFNNVSDQLRKFQTLEIQQKQAVELAQQAAKAQQIEAWSAARREVESRPQMIDFIKQNKLVKSKKQVKQRGAQGLSL